MRLAYADPPYRDPALGTWAVADLPGGHGMSASSSREPVTSGASRQELDLLLKVRARARNLASTFPYQRRGEALYLSTEEWRVLAVALDRMVRDAD